jgi:hypothetical protein
MAAAQQSELAEELEEELTESRRRCAATEVRAPCPSAVLCSPHQPAPPRPAQRLVTPPGSHSGSPRRDGAGRGCGHGLLVSRPLRPLWRPF